MRRKLDNRGLSLVELVIAIAMSTIVIGAATMFLYNAERSYRVAEYTINLQSEAQLLMEQLGNWVMESNWIKVAGSTDSPVLVLYQIDRPKLEFVSDHNEMVSLPGKKRIIFVHGSKLYMITQVEGETEGLNAGDLLNEIRSGTANISAASGTISDEDCICEYLDDLSPFTVALPNGEEIKPETRISVINVTVNMKEGVAKQRQKYSVTNTFSLRNGIMEEAFEIDSSEGD